jgi:hypothetical protein
MSGQFNIGGHTILEHTGVEGAGEVALQNVSFPAGHIIKYHEATNGDVIYDGSLSNTWEYVPAFSLGFNPVSENSKFLFICDLNMMTDGSHNFVEVQIHQTYPSVQDVSAPLQVTAPSYPYTQSQVLTTMVSPNTTDTLNYALAYRDANNDGGRFFMNQNYNQANIYTSRIMVFEFSS